MGKEGVMTLVIGVILGLIVLGAICLYFERQELEKKRRLERIRRLNLTKDGRIPNKGRTRGLIMSEGYLNESFEELTTIREGKVVFFK